MNHKIKIKKYVDSEALSWEERYKRLEKHHIDETRELIKVIEDLEKTISDIRLSFGC